MAFNDRSFEEELNFYLEFNDELEDCSAKWLSKQNKYGDSWRKMHYGELVFRLEEEMREFKDADLNDGSARKELHDIINVALMLSTRLREGAE